MIIIKNKIIPFPGHKHVNICGILFTRSEKQIDSVDLAHEQIHTKQMIGLLIIPYYILYVVFWLIQLIRFKKCHTAYRNIPFEVEAYHKQWLFSKNKSEVTHYSWMKYISYLYRSLTL